MFDFFGLKKANRTARKVSENIESIREGVKRVCRERNDYADELIRVWRDPFYSIQTYLHYEFTGVEDIDARLLYYAYQMSASFNDKTIDDNKRLEMGTKAMESVWALCDEAKERGILLKQRKEPGT